MERQVGRQAGEHSLGKEIGNEGEEEMDVKGVYVVQGHCVLS